MCICSDNDIDPKSFWCTGHYFLVFGLLSYFLSCLCTVG